MTVDCVEPRSSATPRPRRVPGERSGPACGPRLGARRIAQGARRGARAFTLVELLIAITIMALLAAIIVPAISGIGARQARLGVDQVQDLLTMYAYRDSTGAQPVALWGNGQAGELGLWVLDQDPSFADDPATWVPDRFSAPLILPSAVSMVDVRVDGRRLPLNDFIVARQPSQPRPTIEIDLEGEEVETTLVLDPQALTARRVGKGVAIDGYRNSIDLDRQGRDREDW